MPKDIICKYCNDLIYYDRSDLKWMHLYNGKGYQGCILQASIAEPLSTDERIISYKIVTPYSPATDRKLTITTKRRSAAVRYLNFPDTEVFVIVERKFYGE